MQEKRTIKELMIDSLRVRKNAECAGLYKSKSVLPDEVALEAKELLRVHSIFDEAIFRQTIEFSGGHAGGKVDSTLRGAGIELGNLAKSAKFFEKIIEVFQHVAAKELN